MLPPNDSPADSRKFAANLKRQIAASKDDEWAIQQIVEHSLLLTGYPQIDRSAAQVWKGAILKGVAENLY